MQLHSKGIKGTVFMIARIIINIHDKINMQISARETSMNRPQFILSFIALMIFQLRNRGCVIGNYHGASYS